MARKSTGLFQSLINAITGTGETITRTTDFWGNKKTIVHNHRTGTTKEYTHKRGLFSDRTDVKVSRKGNVIGEGSIKKDFFGRAEETLKFKSGRVRKSVKKMDRGFFGNKDETVQYDANGHVVGRKQGHRSLLFNTYTDEYTGECFACNGTGIHSSGNVCRKCDGSGVYRKKRKH